MGEVGTKKKKEQKEGKLTIEVDRKLKQFYKIYIVERHVDSEMCIECNIWNMDYGL